MLHSLCLQDETIPEIRIGEVRGRGSECVCHVGVSGNTFSTGCTNAAFDMGFAIPCALAAERLYSRCPLPPSTYRLACSKPLQPFLSRSRACHLADLRTKLHTYFARRLGRPIETARFL